MLPKQHQFGGRWIACDCSFGNNEPFLQQLPMGFNYLAEIACTRKVWPKACSARQQLEVLLRQHCVS